MIKPPTSGARNDGAAFRTLFNGTFVLLSGSGTIPRVSTGGSYSSVKTPGWKTMTSEQRKYAAPNAFSYDRTVRDEAAMSVNVIRHADGAVQASGGSGLAQWGATSINNWYPFAPYARSFPWPDVAPQATRKALSRVQTKISQAKVNLAQAFAERKQAADMISKRLNLLASVARDIRRGRLGDAYSKLVPHAQRGFIPRRGDVPASSKNLANYWLEYQYGWRPLLSDIHGAAEAIANAYAKDRPFKFVGVGKHRQIIDRTLMSQSNDHTGGFGTLREYTKGLGMVECKSRYVIEAVVDDTAKQRLASTGILNPLLLAWELIPYSFVIDWMIPVGDYLEQLTYASGMKFKRGTLSRRQFGHAQTEWSVWSNAAGYSCSVSGGERICTLTSKDRVVLTGFPYSRFPPFEPEFGIERALSALSLLRQQFGRRR